MPKNVQKLSPKNMLATIRDTYGIDGRYYRFGIEDNFPNLLAEYVNNSGTAKECIDKLNQFLFGQGMKSEVFMKTMANPWETWKEVLQQVIQNVNYFEGYAIQVKFDNAGRPSRYYAMDIQHIRKRKDGMFIYNPDYGDPSGYNIHRKFNNIVIPPYRVSVNDQEEAQQTKRRRELVASQLKEYGEQYGEILYVYKKGIGLNYEHYPVPTYASGLNDITADAGLSLHEDGAVANAFKGGVVIATHKMNNSDKDENEKTEKDYFIEGIQEFIGPNGMPVMHIEANLAEGEMPNITTINIEHQMNATEAATERVAKKVCRLFGVPPIIIGIDTAGKLGDNQELVNKLKLFNLALEAKRELIYTGLERLWPSILVEAFELLQLDLFDYIPDEVIKTMTPEQRNEIYNLPQPTTAVEPTEQVSNPATQPIQSAPETNSVVRTMSARESQGMDRIKRKYDKGQYSEPSAIMQIMTAYGLTEEQARTFLDIENIEDELNN